MKNTLFVVLAIIQVVFASNIHCANCVRKVNENLAFEKGVKDLEVSVSDKTIKVSFDPAKTDTVKLKKAINRLGYSAEVREYKKIK